MGVTRTRGRRNADTKAHGEINPWHNSLWGQQESTGSSSSGTRTRTRLGAKKYHVRLVMGLCASSGKPRRTSGQIWVNKGRTTHVTPSDARTHYMCACTSTCLYHVHMSLNRSMVSPRTPTSDRYYLRLLIFNFS